MTDHEPPPVEDHDPALTPAQEAEVRRLLVEARHESPMPGDVAARLDRVLAQLRTDDDGSPGALAPVSELAARRRRRVTSLLVAAAAVVVVGVGLNQVVDGNDESTGSSSSADSSLSRDSAGGDADASGSAAGDTPAGAPAPEAAASASASADAMSSPLTSYAAVAPQPVSSASFAEDVAAALAATRVATDTSSGAPDGAPDGTTASALPTDDLPDGFACAPGAWGPGTLVPVLFDGEPAVLAFRPTTGDSQVADLLQCGTAEVLRSVTLPVS